MWQFGFVLVFNSIHQKKSDSLNAENCVGVLTISFVYVDSEQPLRQQKENEHTVFVMNLVFFVFLNRERRLGFVTQTHFPCGKTRGLV